MRERGRKPKRLVEPKWTPGLAYVCGLIAADGCLLKDGRHIDVTSQDIEILETCKKYLQLETKIGYKKSSFTGKKVLRIQFSDVVLYRWLISLGFTPAKSKTLQKVDVPSRYFPDFVRGEFDGDGHSHAYWDRRWRSSVSLYIAFTSGSYDHLKWLQEKLTKKIGINGYIKNTTRAYRLEFAKKEARKLHDFMYYSEGLPCLQRKREKLKRQWVAAKRASQGIKIELDRMGKGKATLRIA